MTTAATPSALENLFTPEQLLPSQFFFGAETRDGERRIRLAVLEDVLLTFTRAARCAPSTLGHAVEEIADAVAWLESDDVRWPYSFVNICDALNFEPQVIRKALLGVLGDPARAAAIPAYRRIAGVRTRVCLRNSDRPRLTPRRRG